MTPMCELTTQVQYGLAPLRATLPESLRTEMIDISVRTLPRKAYGLIGGTSVDRPRTIYACSTNLRNTSDWKGAFESFGDFYCDPDRGFVISPTEYLQITRKMERRGEMPVGVFHSHRCRPAEPTELDLAMHRLPELLCYIVSVVRPDSPDLKIYRIDDGRPLAVGYDVA